MEQVTQEVQELSPAIVEAAKKLLAKQGKAIDKAKENVEEKYSDFADATTLRRREGTSKFEVLCTCPISGDKHWTCTSDLFQTHGLSPDAREAAKDIAKAEKKELLARAMEAIKNGDI